MPCAIQIFGEYFPDSRGRVAWSDEVAPGSWSIGFRVDSAEEKSGLLEEKLKELSEHLRKD